MSDDQVSQESGIELAATKSSSRGQRGGAGGAAAAGQLEIIRAWPGAPEFYAKSIAATPSPLSLSLSQPSCPLSLVCCGELLHVPPASSAARWQRRQGSHVQRWRYSGGAAGTPPHRRACGARELSGGARCSGELYLGLRGTRDCKMFGSRICRKLWELFSCGVYNKTDCLQVMGPFSEEVRCFSF